jgi:hypothetical protein
MSQVMSAPQAYITFVQLGLVRMVQSPHTNLFLWVCQNQYRSSAAVCANDLNDLVGEC